MKADTPVELVLPSLHTANYNEDANNKEKDAVNLSLLMKLENMPEQE
jgi:hypothetical protein